MKGLKTGGRRKGSLNKGNPKRQIVADLLQEQPKGTLEEFRAYFAPRMPAIFGALERVAIEGDTRAMQLAMERMYGPAATQNIKVTSENQGGRVIIEVDTGTKSDG